MWEEGRGGFHEAGMIYEERLKEKEVRGDKYNSELCQMGRVEIM